MITKQFEFVYAMTLLVVLLLCFSVATQDENVASNCKTLVVDEHPRKCSQELASVLAKFPKNLQSFIGNNEHIGSNSNIFADRPSSSFSTEIGVENHHILEDNHKHVAETYSPNDNPLSVSEFGFLSNKDDDFLTVLKNDLSVTTNNPLLVFPVPTNYTFSHLKRNKPKTSDNLNENTLQAQGTIISSTNNVPFIPVRNNPFTPPSLPESGHFLENHRLALSRNEALLKLFNIYSRLSSSRNHRVHFPSSIKRHHENSFLRHLINLSHRNSNHLRQTNPNPLSLVNLPIFQQNSNLNLNNFTTASLIKQFLFSLNNPFSLTSDNRPPLPPGIHIPPSLNRYPVLSGNYKPHSFNQLLSLQPNNTSAFPLNSPPSLLLHNVFSQSGAVDNPSDNSHLILDNPVKPQLNRPLFPESDDQNNHPINNQHSSLLAHTLSLPPDAPSFTASDKPTSSLNYPFSLTSDNTLPISSDHILSTLTNNLVPFSLYNPSPLPSDIPIPPSLNRYPVLSGNYKPHSFNQLLSFQPNNTSSFPLNSHRPRLLLDFFPQLGAVGNPSGNSYPILDNPPQLQLNQPLFLESDNQNKHPINNQHSSLLVDTISLPPDGSSPSFPASVKPTPSLNNPFSPTSYNTLPVSSDHILSVLTNNPPPFSSNNRHFLQTNNSHSFSSDNSLSFQSDNPDPLLSNKPPTLSSNLNSLLPLLNNTISFPSRSAASVSANSLLLDNLVSSSDNSFSSQSDDNLFLPPDNFFLFLLNNNISILSNTKNGDDNIASNPFIKHLYKIFRKLLVLQRLYDNCKSSTVPTTAGYLPSIKCINKNKFPDINEHATNRYSANSESEKERYTSYFENGAFYGRERGGFEDREIEDRIMGGHLVSLGEVPYQVALYKLDVFLCGSSLISQYYILTAAHCLKGNRPEELWFKVGSDSLTKGGQTYRIFDFVIHEESLNVDNDIGLLKSASAVKFGPNVKPIPLPSINDPPLLPYTPVEASGWGATRLDGGAQPSYNLQKIHLKIATRQRCRNRIMTSPKLITERQICTIAPVSAGTCFGDSGGPLVANGKLVGIISWGSPCAIGDPDVYTNVQEFLPWIYNQIRKFEDTNKATISQDRNLLPLFNTLSHERM